MVKAPSSHRRPRRPPLPLQLHALRIGLRVPKSGRAGQIQRRSMVKVSELEGGGAGASPPSQQQRRHPSPRRTPQTLTSSDVRSASMCEIQIGAQQQKVGLVTFAEVEANTVQASGSSPLPPEFSDYPDKFKSLGTDRILPPRVLDDLSDPYHFYRYKQYLEQVYYFHKGPGPVTSNASFVDVAKQCLAMEMKLLQLDPYYIIRVGRRQLCDAIIGLLEYVIHDKGKILLPFGALAGLVSHDFDQFFSAPSSIY